MSAEEYNLKESQKAVGQLRPAILARDGWVVDGIHRLRVDPEWRTERHEDIDTEEKKWIARAHANLARRTVGREEKREIINNLAKIYADEGLVIDYLPEGHRGGLPINQIYAKVEEVLKGAMSEWSIRRLIDPRYVQQKASKTAKKVAERKRRETPAIERLKADKYQVEERYGPGFVKKLEEETKEEVREELKRDTGFRDDIKKEVEQELRTDPDFLVEVAQTVDEVIPTISRKPIDEEGYHIPTLTEDQRAELGEAMQRSEKRRRERGEDPWIQERAKWWRAMEAMMSIAVNVEDVYCPVCGEPGSMHLRFTCHPENDMKTVQGLIRTKLNIELADEAEWKAKQ